MEGIKDLLSEKKVNEEVKALFTGMNFEQGQEEAVISDDWDEDLGVNIATRNLAEVKIMWEALNKQEVEKLKGKDEIKNLKLSCTRCLTQDFDKLDTPPTYEDYKRMFHIKSEKVIQTSIKDGIVKKVWAGTNHFFKCECCGAGNCVYVEEGI